MDALSLIFNVLLAAFLFFLYKFFLYQLFWMLVFKLKYGKEVYIEFFPFFGELQNVRNSFKKHGDAVKDKQLKIIEHQYKFKISNFFTNIVFQVVDPEIYRVMLQDHLRYRKVNIFRHDSLVQQGMVFQHGEKWKNQRNLLGDPFKYEYLKSRLPMINEVTNKRLAQLSGEDVSEMLQAITGEVIMRSFFGDDLYEFKFNGREAQIELSEVLNTVAHMRFKSYYVLLKQLILGQRAWTFFPTATEQNINERVAGIRATIQSVINKRLQGWDQKKKSSNDLLDIYLEDYLKRNTKADGAQSTLEEILQQFITFFFAGTDTTAMLSLICLHFFAQYPDAQREIREEVLGVMKNGLITETELPKLVKLNAFIHEVLRMKSPAIRLLLREALETHVVRDITIRKGWYVAIDINSSQHLEKYYESPEKFDYKRWLNKNPVKGDNGFVFIPFSAGPRNCIGQHMAQMEAKIILSQVLSKYEIQPNQNVQVQWMVKVLYQISPGNVVKLRKL